MNSQITFNFDLNSDESPSLIIKIPKGLSKDSNVKDVILSQIVKNLLGGTADEFMPDPESNKIKIKPSRSNYDWEGIEAEPVEIHPDQVAVMPYSCELDDLTEEDVYDIRTSAILSESYNKPGTSIKHTNVVFGLKEETTEFYIYELTSISDYNKAHSKTAQYARAVDCA